MGVNGKIAICMSEKDISQFAMRFPALGIDQELWSRAIQSGCFSRFVFLWFCPVAAANKDLFDWGKSLQGNSESLTPPLLTWPYSLLTPLHSFTAHTPTSVPCKDPLK